MPLNTDGDILYHGTLDQGGVRYQVDPPVCNGCEVVVTVANLGSVELAQSPHAPGSYEMISCQACTVARPSQAARERWLSHHGA